MQKWIKSGTWEPREIWTFLRNQSLKANSKDSQKLIWDQQTDRQTDLSETRDLGLATKAYGLARDLGQNFSKLNHFRLKSCFSFSLQLNRLNKTDG